MKYRMVAQNKITRQWRNTILVWLASIYTTGLKKDYLPSAWYQFRLNTGFMSLIMKHLIDEVETEVSTDFMWQAKLGGSNLSEKGTTEVHQQLNVNQVRSCTQTALWEEPALNKQDFFSKCIVKIKLCVEQYTFRQLYSTAQIDLQHPSAAQISIQNCNVHLHILTANSDLRNTSAPHLTLTKSGQLLQNISPPKQTEE